ncbi:MAG TPA: TylF/MycF/NovP-related O-methyltransferase [Burkholderiales bacterium]|nr:TylF/MycF/NovP-related O-methyltransferase [Burkholderiales bacterium]
MLLKKLMQAIGTPKSGSAAAAVEYPLELEAKLGGLHAKAPIQVHLDILHGDLRIGSERFVDLYFRCLEATGTALTPFTVFQRFQTRQDLVRYFLATLGVPGARTECGAYRGATALLLCHAWRSIDASFRGDGFYLIDSFSGTSASTVHDLIPVRNTDGAPQMAPFFPPGKTDVTVDVVRGYFSEFPGATLCEGWIPDVFAKLPTTAWSFVHLDLTLYEPTLAALQYFYPALSTGGVIVCDGSLFCPGVQQALDEFSATSGAAYVTLGYREAVFMKA